MPLEEVVKFRADLEAAMPGIPSAHRVAYAVAYHLVKFLAAATRYATLATADRHHMGGTR